MTVKHFSLDYNKVNERGTFSPGDILSGRVTVVTSKEIKVQCFLVRAKGKAKVTWYEQEGRATEVHSDKKKYFYFEHIILQDKNKGDGSEIIGPGRNVYPFTFMIPHTDMPSSYEGKWGKITYSLRAQLTQSIWLVHKTKSEFPFASKSEMIIIGLKNFSIEYDAINSRNTFTNGDTINGRIIVEVSKETKISSLIFRAQGRAHVSWSELNDEHHHHHHHHHHECWSEHYGQHNHHECWSDEKYYDIQHHILREARQDGTEVIGQGRHVFPFSFTIPNGRIPSSFKSSIGKIVHKLKAELKQPMRLTKEAKSHFTFVSQADMDLPGLMDPQYGCKDKSVMLFGSGNISMDVHTKRMGYKQGEDLQVTVQINNRSTRSVKPKFILYVKTSFFAQGRRRVSTNEILKDKCEAVAPSGKETVTKVITIPRELPPSILNCSIIKLEYRLKVQLNIKYALDPEIKLPIVVLPACEAPAMEQASAPAAYGFEAFGNPTQKPWSTTPGQQAAPHPMDPPPPYGACALYPSYPSPGKY